MRFDNRDLDALALCGWMEARGEGIEGMRAVMHVVCNRAKAWHGGLVGSIRNVVYAPNKFSWTRPDDPEFHTRPAEGDILYQDGFVLACKIADGSDWDSTKGALYYANLEVVDAGWFERHIVDDKKEHPVLAVIGHHTFFA